MSDNRPIHSPEHDSLMQLVMCLAESHALIGHYIVITIGNDGRPIVGSTIVDNAQIHQVLRELGNAEQHATTPEEIVPPKMV